ncbi:hypothetical protein CEXT_214541, partial [Caerostris extrusa]
MEAQVIEDQPIGKLNGPSKRRRMRSDFWLDIFIWSKILIYVENILLDYKYSALFGGLVAFELIEQDVTPNNQSKITKEKKIEEEGQEEKIKERLTT